MKITLLFFGIAHDIAGVRQIPLEITDGATVLDLRHRLAQDYTGLDDTLGYALAVNEKVAAPQQILNDGDVAAVLPPVSGG
jgi:molybdopterin synthase sulfur carrier subunit